jgi:Protein of unknown function (DUF4058)
VAGGSNVACIRNDLLRDHWSMPSPFPGMDPFLEAPDNWLDFHDALASEIRAVLNQLLPAPNYARLEMRPEVGIVAEGISLRRIVRDVFVVRQLAPKADGGVAVLDQPRTMISPYLEVQMVSETIRHAYVEIRDGSRGHHLITLLEIASPSNNESGPDRDQYHAKQREILESDASLIELDLLRRGKRLFPYPKLDSALAGRTPRTDYVVVVNRSWTSWAEECLRAAAIS